MPTFLGWRGETVRATMAHTAPPNQTHRDTGTPNVSFSMITVRLCDVPLDHAAEVRMFTRRNVAQFGALALLAYGLISSAAAAAPVAASCARTDSEYQVDNDIQNDSYPDSVIGVPRASVGGQRNAGVVDIQSAGAGSIQRFDESLFPQLGTPTAGDQFGTAVAFANLDTAGQASDSCADLAIGAPGADGGRGAVVVAHGSNDGITSDDAVVLTGRTAGERFGAQITVSGADLWIAAPDRAVDGAQQAGAVDHYLISGTGGVTFVGTITQNTPGVPGGAENGDHFGSVLSAFGRPLAIGDPDEDIGAAADAGSVTFVFDDSRTGAFTAAATFSQNTPGIPGSSEADDHFGASIGTFGTRYDVGVPDEALGNVKQVGTVDIFGVRQGSATPSQPSALTQNSAGVPGSDEAGDHFGAALVSTSDDGSCIGVPGEDLGTVSDAGRVVCDRGGTWHEFDQGDSVQAGAQYGARLGAQSDRDFTDQECYRIGGQRVLIDAPGRFFDQAPDAGLVTTDDGTPDDLGTGFLDSSGPEAGEQYGIIATAPIIGVSHAPCDNKVR